MPKRKMPGAGQGPLAEAPAAPQILDGVERWPIGRLKPYPGNPKLHPPEQLAKIADSMRRRKITTPLEIEPDGTIIKGHGRWLAAREAGFTELPVIVRSDLTKEEIHAVRIEDNLTAESGWENDLLLKEIDLAGPEFAAGLYEIEISGGDDLEAGLEKWEFGDVHDEFVITIRGRLDMQGEVRQRLRGMEGMKIETSTIQIP